MSNLWTQKRKRSKIYADGNLILHHRHLICGRSVVFADTPVSATNKTDRHDIIQIFHVIVVNIQEHYTLRFYFLYLSLLAQPVNILDSNMTSIKRHTRYYSITLYLVQVRYTTNLAGPCDSRCEITVTTECKQTKHRHIAYF